MTTPLEIQIALHYYACMSDFRDGDFSAPAVRAAIDDFKARGFIAAQSSVTGVNYRGTEALNVWVEALMAIPKPVQKWVIPSEAADIAEQNAKETEG